MDSRMAFFATAPGRTIAPVGCRDVSQRRLEVVRGGDVTAGIRVVQVEVKVPEEPHERRREGAELADAAGAAASLGPDADVTLVISVTRESAIEAASSMPPIWL